MDEGAVMLGDSPDHPLADHPYLAMLDASPFAPPTPEASGVSKDELRELVRSGQRDRARRVLLLARSDDDGRRSAWRDYLLESPEGITASAVRSELGTTRKYVLPILGYLDAAGITRRRGDVRIGGPRLPSSATGPGA